jgi:hypothetical protein
VKKTRDVMEAARAPDRLLDESERAKAPDTPGHPPWRGGLASNPTDGACEGSTACHGELPSAMDRRSVVGTANSVRSPETMTRSRSLSCSGHGAPRRSRAVLGRGPAERRGVPGRY